MNDNNNKHQALVGGQNGTKEIEKRNGKKTRRRASTGWLRRTTIYQMVNARTRHSGERERERYSSVTKFKHLIACAPEGRRRKKRKGIHTTLIQSVFWLNQTPMVGWSWALIKTFRTKDLHKTHVDWREIICIYVNGWISELIGEKINLFYSIVSSSDGLLLRYVYNVLLISVHTTLSMHSAHRRHNERKPLNKLTPTYT